MNKQSPLVIRTERTHQIFLKVTECSSKIFKNQTGRFTITSSRRYKYIMIAYDYDSNNILAESIKSRTSLQIKNAYQTMRKLLCSRGLTPNTHVLDNECSKVLKEYMEEENETFQLVPPHLHRRNAAEIEIHTFKNHFISGMVSTHKDSPPPFVVLSIAPSHCHTEPAVAIKNKSHLLSTCTTPWLV